MSPKTTEIQPTSTCPGRPTGLLLGFLQLRTQRLLGENTEIVTAVTKPPHATLHGKERQGPPSLLLTAAGRAVDGRGDRHHVSPVLCYSFYW